MEAVKLIRNGNTRGMSILLALACVLCLTALYYTQNAFLEAFEERSYDLRFKTLRGSLAPHPDIAIIAIDDHSIEALGRFPWSRLRYVELFERLAEMQPRAVLLDAFFPEQQDTEVDAAFAQAIQQAGNVVLSTTFDLDRQGQVRGRTGSLSELERAAAGIGHINLFPEEDGVNRRNLLLLGPAGQTVPSLGLMGAMLTLGESSVRADSFAVALGSRSIPVGHDGAMWINFPGEPGAYPRYSFVDVLQRRVDPNRLRGKTIFVGATALGIYDMRVTPFHGNTPGVEVHAAVADSILSQRYIRRTGLHALFDLGAMAALGLLSFYATARLRLPHAMAGIGVLAVAYVGFSHFLFLRGHWVSMIYPLLSALAALLVGGGYRYLVLEKSAREMRAMFSSYLSNKLVLQLERDPAAARIGGDARDVTVMFTDIKGFTSFTERHVPEAVVARLNEYLQAMVQLIQQHDGTVDKFIGDGIMAYWGAPLPQPDHAKRAVACALAMQEVMRQLEAGWRRRNVEPFQIRGGIQSGNVVAGNIGSQGRKMEYTVIGDTVNQAARLEGTAKHYGVSFVVGDNTYLKTCDTFRFRRLDRIRVVGKDVPVAIYELRGTVPPTEDRLEGLFAAAMSIFKLQRWEEAGRAFAAILTEFPDDGPSKVYQERCEHFKTVPVDADWDGVFNREEK